MGPSFGMEVRNHAKGRLDSICNHFENDGTRQPDFSRPRLIRYTHAYSCSQESGDYFLRIFHEAVGLSVDGNEPLDFEEIRPKFFGFGDSLFNDFFLPVKASARKTPQPSPAWHAAVQEAQGQDGQPILGTEPRLSVMQRDCLIRDRYRCVISRRFDIDEAAERAKHAGSYRDARDGDGNFLRDDPYDHEHLHVAHILPHSLTQPNASGELGDSKATAHKVLDMFDVGIADLISGPDIDRPRNALTLTGNLHVGFESFKIYFDLIDPDTHTYSINTFFNQFFGRQLIFPVNRTLFLTREYTIEPPSSRFLAIHRAIAHVLHLSGAGYYIDRLLEHMEENGV